MEPGIREFFKRIVSTVSLLILWMIINMTIGIKYNGAFYEDNVHWYNVVFYVWLIASFIALVWFCIKIWRKPIEDLHD
jgi:drug/metabolite transporter (DMT)-like permease